MYGTAEHHVLVLKRSILEGVNPFQHNIACARCWYAGLYVRRSTRQKSAGHLKGTWTTHPSLTR